MYLEHFFIVSKVNIQHFFLQDSISVITITKITCPPSQHATQAIHASTLLTHARFPHHPRRHAAHVTHATHVSTPPAPPTLACHPRHPRQHEQHVISQTNQIHAHIHFSLHKQVELGLSPQSSLHFQSLQGAKLLNVCLVFD